jgi:hypothetical protein
MKIQIGYPPEDEVFTIYINQNKFLITADLHPITINWIQENPHVLIQKLIRGLNR